MKRGGPLRRKAPLKSGGQLKRTPLSPESPKRKRTKAQQRRFRQEVLRRAGFRCERCGWQSHLHAHHLLPRSRGGLDKPENGACLCRWCHGAVHDHTAPDWRRWLRSGKSPGSL